MDRGVVKRDGMVLNMWPRVALTPISRMLTTGSELGPEHFLRPLSDGCEAQRLEHSRDCLSFQE